MPKSKWLIIILACLLLVGGVFYWQKNGSGPAPEPLRESEEAWIPATEPLLVNINTADLKELDKLPGIGPGKAAAIIAFREAHGPFQSIEELMLVPGIKEATFARLEPYVTD